VNMRDVDVLRVHLEIKPACCTRSARRPCDLVCRLARLCMHSPAIGAPREPVHLMPFFSQKLEPTYKGRCAFLKVDAQQNYLLAQHYQVSKLPTVLVFRGGVQASAVCESGWHLRGCSCGTHLEERGQGSHLESSGGQAAAGCMYHCHAQGSDS